MKNYILYILFLLITSVNFLQAQKEGIGTTHPIVNAIQDSTIKYTPPRHVIVAGTDIFRLINPTKFNIQGRYGLDFHYMSNMKNITFVLGARMGVNSTGKITITNNWAQDYFHAAIGLLYRKNTKRHTFYLGPVLSSFGLQDRVYAPKESNIDYKSYRENNIAELDQIPEHYYNAFYVYAQWNYKGKRIKSVVEANAILPWRFNKLGKTDYAGTYVRVLRLKAHLEMFHVITWKADIQARAKGVTYSDGIAMNQFTSNYSVNLKLKRIGNGGVDCGFGYMTNEHTFNFAENKESGLWGAYYIRLGIRGVLTSD